MIDLELFFKEKTAVPDWFKNHEIFKDTKQVTKIFPSIGLPNFSVESDLENTNTVTLITNLCSEINDYLNNARYYFDTTAPQLGGAVREGRVNKFAPASRLVASLYTQLANSKSFVKDFEVKKGLYLQKDIMDANKKVFAKAGESLFKVYPKIVEFCRKHYNYTLPTLESMRSFKEYSSNNFNGKLNVVFSSDGVEGAWDILTMSQRGIQSCQGWNGQYKNCTIGSLLDPFTAIMYLTAGTKTEFGSKMIRRCIVRFAVDRFMKRPCLFLEYMYPNNHPATIKAFKEAIRSKIGDKFPIILERSVNSDKYYVPYDSTSDLLLKHSNATYVNYKGNHNYYGIFPYRDTYMEYKLKNNVAGSAAKCEASKTAKILELGQTLHQNTHMSDNYIELVKKFVQEETFAKIDMQSCNDSKDYLRRACINYFANKQSITAQLIAKINAEMKTHKDTSIFIPGIELKDSAPAKSKKNTKATKPQAKPKIEKKPSMADSVERDVIPAISKIFKTTWTQMIAIKANKTKRKAKSKKAANAA